MGKKGTKGRGVVAIALFEIAGAMERWAAAQERIAASNEKLRDQAAVSLALQKEEAAFRQNEIPGFKASMRELDDLLVTLRSAVSAEAQVTPASVAAERAALEAQPRLRAHYHQSDRRFLYLDAFGRPYPSLVFARKKARILAFIAEVPFVVETDRGPMTGEAGDYIVTNHPDDDPGSDLWTISRERFESTYEVLSDGDA